MQKTILISIALLCIICAVLVSVWYFRDREADLLPPETRELSAPVPETEAETITEAPDVTVPILTSDNVDAVSATRRMYMAHAPLREPEVADPDSETNRRTLQTMVEKSMARQRLLSSDVTTVSNP